MNESCVDGNYRAISIVALVQTGVIVAGTFLVCAMMKIFYQDQLFPSLSTEMALIRHHGFYYLLIPLLWTASTLYIVRHTSHPWFPPITLWVGIGLIVFTGYRYLVVCIQSLTDAYGC